MPLDKPLNLDFDSSGSPSNGLPDQHSPSPKSGDLATQIEELKKELQAKNRILDAKNQEISELKIKNRQLNDTNNDIQARQKILEEELGKAEAQIELIQELLLEDESSEASKKEESGKHE
ncbi:hypothetical protein EDC38_0631 [Marinimicrobium koreense]|uniref:Uncharacterized protein n=1 Tax=Marinimicrobium koreense TaxID=306545 RepID=A0A3N1NXL6_9GAMM|nr:hypothetical protein [Marinimicrobium koreense]ROQ20038.1 hypothetical protein EDC38_0631 [Marinimicrobium koreense]